MNLRFHMSPPKCRRCEIEMEVGYLPDATDGAWLAPKWVRGAPERSFWVGLSVPVKVGRHDVQTFRCPTCGLLESYALP